jgi:hypothetical protein
MMGTGGSWLIWSSAVIIGVRALWDTTIATRVSIDTSIAIDMTVSNDMFLSDISIRLKKAIDWRRPGHGAISALAKETGLNRATLSAAYTGRNHPNAEILSVVCNLWPEYTLWLMTGQVSPEAGQTSPELEQLEELQKSVGK